MAEERLEVLAKYRSKLRECREIEARLKSARDGVADLGREYEETEANLRALQVNLFVSFSHGCFR